MKEISFDSAESLYKRLLPALKSKRKILSKSGYSYIKEKDIWDALRNQKWNKTIGLELCDMVDDILHTESIFFNNYFHQINDEVDILSDMPKLKSNE